MSEEKSTCPKCGMPVSKTDRFCKNCGATLTAALAVSASVMPSPSAPEVKVEPPYERKFSVVQRLYKVLVAPGEAMRDIALAPDYEGVAVVIVVELILSILSVALAFQKLQFVGANASTIVGLITAILIVGYAIAVAFIVARWLIKALLVKVTCDSGSGWSFKAAASVTGYAYFPAVILSIVGLVVTWFLVPSFTINTTNLEQAILDMTAIRAQLNWLILVYGLPMSFVGLIWKSYVGGLGAHFGTKEKCSVGMGVAIFFILGLVGLVISFAGYLF